VSYANPRLGGTVHFSSVHVALPTVTGVTPQVGSTAAVR